MASTFSTDLKLELMATGENAGTWGDKTNTNLNLVQQAIAGYQEVSIAGGAQTTPLVMSDAALSNARNAVIKFIGTITGNQVVTIPDGIEKTYTLINGTSGTFTVEFKTASGTGFTFFTTAMQDANYTAASITLSHDREGQQATTVIQGNDSTIDLMSTTQIQICTGSTGNNSYQDKAVVCLIIFR
jgi:hypothetical protein